MYSFNPKWLFICSSVHSMHKDNPLQLPTISQIHVYQSPYLIYHPSVTHTSVISLDKLSSVSVCRLYPSSAPASNSTRGGNREAKVVGQAILFPADQIKSGLEMQMAVL